MLTAVLVLALPFSAVAATAAPSGAPAAAELDVLEGYGLLQDLMDERRRVRRQAVDSLLAAEDRRWIAPLVDAYFFIPGIRRAEALAVLEGLSGERPGERYLDWVEWIGANPQSTPPRHRQWKAELLAQIDDRYRTVFYDGAPIEIRLEEIVSGGVAFDGIPSLDQPPHVRASEVRFLDDDDLVLGVVLGGEARAWPVKVLSWHEMLNDVVGGEPVALSYCTLCGSAILYSTRTPNGGAYTLGTSGLLYRSNKLMFDRESYSLWSNLTGEAVVGRKAVAGARLEMLPVTLTRWRAWRERHPETTVLEPDPALGRRWGFRYEEGAADEARRGVSFPVWQKSDALDPRAEVYAVSLEGEARVWPLERLQPGNVVEDRLADTELLLVVDDAGAVRVYERGDHRFVALRDGRPVDREGRAWTLNEGELLPPSGAELRPLPRVAGHVAFWFGWFGFHPDTTIWSPE